MADDLGVTEDQLKDEIEEQLQDEFVKVAADNGITVDDLTDTYLGYSLDEMALVDRHPDWCKNR